MAREKFWAEVGPLIFIADGGTEGEIQVQSTKGLYVKQAIILKSSTVVRVDLEIKRVLSKTVFKVGRKGHRTDDFANITNFLVSDNATIRTLEQTKRIVPPENIIQAKFAGSPTNGDRSVLVDYLGRTLDSSEISNGEIVLGVNQVPDFTETPIYKNIIVSATPALLRVNTDNLVGRRILIIQPKSRTIYIGWDSLVTSSNGLLLSASSVTFLKVSADVDVYAVSSSGTIDVHITEGR